MLRLVRHLRLPQSPPHTRGLGWTATTFAQPKVKRPQPSHIVPHSVAQDVAATLERTPVVQTVRRRMQLRSELHSKAMEDVGSPESAQAMKQIGELESLHTAWQDWESTKQLLEETTSLLQDPDPTMRSLAEDEHGTLLNKLSVLAEKTFPSLLVPPSKTAHLSAMMELKAGVGGSEATLFVGEVVRMYSNLAHTMGWQPTLVSKSVTDNGGLKYAILNIEGEKVYDTLRWESGVHRVQRVPQTDAAGRVHTSTVTVVTLPLSKESDSDAGEELYKMEDVTIEVMRSNGAGGQHVNKTESAVRLTHVPTGITVAMQDERSQHLNRRRAFQVLKARLLDRKLNEEMMARRDVRRNLVGSADRSEKIRTYNFQQSRVTDHRIGLSLNNLDSVMEGDGLRDFLDELAKKHQDELLEEAFTT